MPIFHDPLTLFVHIPKNAGRSVEKVMMDVSGNPDWGRPNIFNRAAKLAILKTRSAHAWKHMVGTQDITVAAQHLTYTEMELLGLLPEGTPKSVFCICRNPFDRAVSSVTHFMGSQDTPEEFDWALAEWLDRSLNDHNQRAHRRTQLAFIRNSRGAPVATDILRFETLGDDFKAFSVKIGRPELELPWRGKAERRRDLSGLVNARARSRIEDAFAEDLEYFGYDFPD